MKLAKVNTALIIIGLALGAYFLSSQKEMKIGYFDGNDVFTEFQMTKDLNISVEGTMLARTKILDSLRFDLEALQRRLKASEPQEEELKMFDAKRQEYMMKESQFTTESSNQTAQYNDQIFKQLRQYVDDFKTEYKYDLVLGLGSGGIVSTAEGIDVSKSLVNFINGKYKGN